MDTVAFGGPKIGKIISDGFFRPGVTESFARETPVHLGYDRVEAFRVTIGWIIHYRLSVELRVSVRDPVCVHEFHSLKKQSL